ncbi:MAG: hypothetical protein JRH20_14870 [Deltaproteobacteria bacterium]|nr:hypothetical protein [Deltaproteobacteria bacterium]
MRRDEWLEFISHRVPDHARRAALRELEQVAERLVLQQEVVEEGVDDAPLVSLLLALGEIYRELMTAQQELRDQRDTLAGSASDEAARTVVRESLIIANREGLSADIQAVDRFLDQEAMDLRCLYTIHPLAQQWQLAATVAATRVGEIEAGGELPAWTSAFRTASDSVAQSSAQLLRDRQQHWWLRVVACELLGSLAPLSQRQGPRVRQLLLNTLLEHSDTPWVQAAALNAYVQARISAGQEIAGVIADVATPPLATLENLGGARPQRPCADLCSAADGTLRECRRAASSSAPGRS